MKKWIVVMLAALAVGGCVKSLDPVTGEKKYSIDPCEAAEYEKKAEEGIAILTAVGAFVPELLTFAITAGGLLGYWKTKIKPELADAKTLDKIAILGIDAYREKYPKRVDELVAELEAVKRKFVSPEDMLRIENLIRAVRGLPAKA